jgi:hypothetical protein
MAKRLSRRPLRRILKLQVELGPYSGEGIDSVTSKTFNIAKIECEKFRRDPIGGSLLVQLGKMMGPQIDAFDEEVFLATLSERLKINHHSFARSGRVGVGRALPRV